MAATDDKIHMCDTQESIILKSCSSNFAACNSIQNSTDSNNVGNAANMQKNAAVPIPIVSTVSQSNQKVAVLRNMNRSGSTANKLDLVY